MVGEENDLLNVMSEIRKESRRLLKIIENRLESTQTDLVQMSGLEMPKDEVESLKETLENVLVETDPAIISEALDEAISINLLMASDEWEKLQEYVFMLIKLI